LDLVVVLVVVAGILDDLILVRGPIIFFFATLVGGVTDVSGVISG
jgi:hypothetical protein